MADEVIEELWRVKEAMARECGYDVTRLAADLQRRQQEHAHRIVDLQALHKAADQEESAGTDS
ncbi:MAG: hypothetical protein F4X77_19930 [Acidobacteriia bacterium]|nr:hypothetical protein [Terriglobia bacterium]MYC67701.1 hypothetical protein [Terriglobia bacterium]